MSSLRYLFMFCLKKPFLTHPFIQQILLSAYYVPGTVLVASGTSVKEQTKSTIFCNLHILMGKHIVLHRHNK